jgi:hypothetical protein
MAKSSDTDWQEFWYVYIEKVDLWGRPPQTPLRCTELYPYIFWYQWCKKISSVFDSMFKEVDLRGRPLQAPLCCAEPVASYGQILMIFFSAQFHNNIWIF